MNCAALCMALDVPRLFGPIHLGGTNKSIIGDAMKNMKTPAPRIYPGNCTGALRFKERNQAPARNRFDGSSEKICPSRMWTTR